MCTDQGFAWTKNGSSTPPTGVDANAYDGACCGPNGQTNNVNGSVVIGQLCYNDGTAYSWQDANDTNNLFKIKSITNSYDVVSNSADWVACNATLQTIATPTTLSNLAALTYTGFGSTAQIAGTLAAAPSLAPSTTQNYVPADSATGGYTVVTPSGTSSAGGGTTTATTNPLATTLASFYDYSHLAQRFLCWNRNSTQSIFEECCGWNLAHCLNTNLPDRVRRTGNVESSLYEFVSGTDSQNYALLFGFQAEGPGGDKYVLELPTTPAAPGVHGAENPITDWSTYQTNGGYLEFYLTYANPPLDSSGNNYLKISLNDYGTYSKVLNVMDYVLNPPEQYNWLHVKIPLSEFLLSSSSSLNSVSKIVIWANTVDVPETTNVTHAGLSDPFGFRNIFGMDRIFLSQPDPTASSGGSAISDARYCSALPGKDTGAMWFRTEDLDNSSLVDGTGTPIGQNICNSVPGWGWTGTQCCGNDVDTAGLPYFGESYADTQAGCIKGRPVPNDTFFNYVNVSTNAGNHSLLFLNGVFYDCNPASYLTTQSILNAENLSYNGLSTQNISDVTSPDKDCSTLGSDYYCDLGDSTWHSVNEGNYGVPVNSTSTRLDNSASKCCPQNWCGLNQSTCVPNQATNYLDLPYNYSNSNTALITRGTGGDVQKRCISGAWVTAVPKWNPTKTEQGYCPNPTDCYHDSTSGCRPDGYSNLSEGDFYCQSGSWTTRTKLIALQLLNLTNSVNYQSYTLYCDSYDRVLNEYNYQISGTNPTVAKTIILGNPTALGYECPNLVGTGTPCSNNFCILNYQDTSGNHTLVGTSLNLPVNTTDFPAYSFLNLFSEAVSQHANYNDYCDNAITSSLKYGQFYGCSGSTKSSVSIGSSANIWYNANTNSIIYSKDGTTLQAAATTFSDWVGFFFRSPIQMIVNLFFGSQTVPDFAFTQEVNDFNTAYISDFNGGAKVIRGYVEPLGPQHETMILNYLGLDKTLCSSSVINSTLGPFTNNNCVTGSTNNQTYITYDQNIISTYWNDLTTRTRLS